ncbi:MAG: MlaD family protein [Chitinophagaceae bacterium]
MKITNEAKIGILAVVAIALLILGFNFLKGKSLFDKSKKLYAVFHSVEGLSASNPVTINGLRIGSVTEMQEKDRSLDSIVVTITLEKDIDITRSSLAYINKDLLGTATVNIALGDSSGFIKDGDTLNTLVTTGLVDDVKASLNPALNNVNGALKSLDSLIEVVGSIFNPATKYNFQAIVTNLTKSSVSLQALLNSQTGALAQTLSNMNKVSANLANSNENITKTIDNLGKASTKLAALNIEETMASINKTMAGLNEVVAKANSSDGSLGLLLNDKKLYTSLENTSHKMNILLDDLRVHPKRYVSFSVFGKKDKGNYLTAPLVDSTNTGN